MAEAGSEILPERRGGTGIVGGEKQGEHEDQADDAGGADENAEQERKSDGEFAVGYQESDRCCVGENEIAKDRSHERIGAAFGQEFVDPELKAAMQGELRSEDFVLAENEEEDADSDAESSQGTGVKQFGRLWHGRMIDGVG